MHRQSYWPPTYACRYRGVLADGAARPRPRSSSRRSHPRGDDSGCGASDSVGSEDEVVGRVLTGELLGEVGPHRRAQLFAGHLGALIGVDVVAVAGGPMDQLVGQFIVVLQRVDQ